MDWLEAILGVVKTAAPIAANIVLPGSGSIVGGLMDSVLQAKAGYSDEALSDMPVQAKAKLIQENPELLKELERQACELEMNINENKTKNMEQVNETIKAELQSGAWYQRAWRPFNGFMFPIAVLACYVGVPIWAWHYNALVHVEVPQTLWMIWGGVMGVAVYGRNKEKVQQTAGSAAGGIMKLVNKLRS